jgi:hypothetical protein
MADHVDPLMSVDEDEQSVTQKKEQQTKVNNTSKGKKRKRTKKRSEEEESKEILQIKQEQYNKILYQAKKQLLKHAKLCRTFLLQKKIRKLKQQASETQEDKLQSVKDLPLDQVVDQALRQLGLLHANPDPNAEFIVSAPSVKCTQVDAILTHKRFKIALEEWHKKITKYRRWTLTIDERRLYGAKGKRSKKLKQLQKQKQQQQPTSLFCSLNENEGNTDGHSQDISPYGPGAHMEDDPIPIKKNRKGQRARRAKAIAIEAKKEGRQYESLNWRKGNEEQKNKRQNQQREDFQKNPENSFEEPSHPSWSAKQARKTGIVAFEGTKISFGGNDTVNSSNEEKHPSWAAKQAQSTGIVVFKGTKITFD